MLDAKAVTKAVLRSDAKSVVSYHLFVLRAAGEKRHAFPQAVVGKEDFEKMKRFNKGFKSFHSEQSVNGKSMRDNVIFVKANEFENVGLLSQNVLKGIPNQMSTYYYLKDTSP